MTTKRKPSQKKTSRKPKTTSVPVDVPELIPRLRIDTALRNRLRMPLTKEYVDTVHVYIDHMAREIVLNLAMYSEISFNARNQLMAEYKKEPKTRMDIGALSSLYLEVPKDVQARVEELTPMVRDLKEKIGFLRATQQIMGMLIED